MTPSGVVIALLLSFGPSARPEATTSTTTVNTDPAGDVRETALRYLGRPYVIGGQGRPGFDCSGFVRRVYSELGYRLPRVSRDQAQVGRAVPINELAPGDLLFFADRGQPIRHVGLYLGDGELIHASSSRGQVAVDEISSRWYRRRLVGARRILGGSSALTDPSRFSATREHEGGFGLAPTLRRSDRRPEANYGPALAGAGSTGVGVRSGVLTEDGVAAFVLAPELSLVVDDWGFELTTAVVVRFAPGRSATVGRFDVAKDYFRFLRTIRLGLPGAELEIVASRLGDLSLGSGAMVDHAAPGTTGGGVPGLTVAHMPLPVSFAVRTDSVFARAVLDDALVPRWGGLDLGFRAGRFTVGLAAATDRAARATEQEGAIDGLELYSRAALMSSAQWSVDAFAQSTLLRSFSKIGLGSDGGLSVQYRFSDANSVSLQAHAGYQGPRSMYGVFGPTYLAHRIRHGDALIGTRGRAVVGGELRLDAGKWRWAVAYADGLGDGADALDRAVRGMLAVRGLALGGTRLLDVRAVYVARAWGQRRRAADVAQVGLRLRFSSWLAGEAYYQLGRRGDGGLGLTLALSI